MKFGECSSCKRKNTGENWCQSCNSKRFQRDFDKWTSGNKRIDKLIQGVQLKARSLREVIEWIPYSRLGNIKYLAKGGFSTIYKAIWLDGRILNWDEIKQNWERHGVRSNVVLKSLNNSSNINEDFLNEWKNHLQCHNDSYNIVTIYGITQDPETSNYMIVMYSMSEGNLRSNLLIKKYNPLEKYSDLMYVARALSTLHKHNLVHGDFHSGNILLNINTSLGYNVVSYISDFGLSRPADQAIKPNEVYGVIPYMAPEVLRGKPYTKAADIYSFGIIMWELTSGIPAFNDVSHDYGLSLAICKGLRPTIVESTPSEYARLMKRCLDADPNKRPTASELFEILRIWHDYYDYDYYLDNRIPVPDDVPITENHPLSYYTSRKIDFSAKLNEDLSSKIVAEKEYNSIATSVLSESLENCRVTSNSRIDNQMQKF